MKKRIVAVIMTLVMVMALLPTTVFATNSITFRVVADKSTAVPGDTINYTVKMGAVTNLAYLKIKLSIPAGLTYVSGSAPADIETTLNAKSAAYTDSTKIFLVGSAEYTGTGEIVLFSFSCKVDETAKGNSTVTLIVDDDDDIFDVDDNNIPYTVTPATVTIKGAHEHTYTPHDAKKVTCKEDGNIEYYTCTCGKYFKLDGAKYVEISKADTVISKSTAAHKLTHVDAVVPTNCSTDAVAEHWKCTVCGKLFTDAAGNTETTLAKLTTPAAHKLSLITQKNATCTEDGMKAHYQCSACGKLFTDMDGKNETTADALKIPAAHKLSLIAQKNATCTEDGMKAHYQCSVCKKLFTDEDGKNVTNEAALKIPAAHNIVAVAKKDATCTENGYKAHYKCTVCKQLFSDEDGKKPIDAPVVIKAAHKPVKVDAKPSTCLAEGWTEHYKCSVCGKLFSDAAGETGIDKVPTLPLASHTAASSAYVSDANNHWQLCKWCGLKINEAAHTWNKPATEDDAVYCTECGYVKTAAKTPCEKHTPGDLVADGAYHYTFCAECGTQLSKKEHTYGTATTVDGKKVEVCTECGYVKTTATTPITPPVNPSKPGNSGSNTGSKPVQSQKTFDAGIALYAGMAVLSLTGSAWMITKKKKEH